jgi:hypothetical protein
VTATRREQDAAALGGRAVSVCLVSHSVELSTKRAKWHQSFWLLGLLSMRNRRFVESLITCALSLSAAAFSFCALCSSDCFRASSASSSVDVDAAYKQLIAGSDENKVLEAARRMTAGKPHFLYKDELDQLNKIMD